jgi:hypothetical protein
MNSNFENLIKTQINGILEAFTSDLENVLEGKDFFSQEERKKIYEDFLNVLEFISSYEDEVDPKIKDKINHIKRLLNTSNDICEGEEHPLNITPLSDVQEN